VRVWVPLCPAPDVEAGKTAACAANHLSYCGRFPNPPGLSPRL